MFKLEALQAKHGDSLLLHFGSDASPKLAVIDGGPGGVWRDTLKPRLEAIRKQRGLEEGQPLDIEMMMVSHLDADHITGILDLMRNLRDLRDKKKPQPWKIRRFWHNAFDDLTASNSAKVASFGEGSDLLASVGQGRELRDLVKLLDLEGNKPFNGIVKHPHDAVKLGSLTVTVVGPDEQNLAKLQADWDKKVAALLEKEKEKERKAAELADYVDKSVYNLSSIVLWAEQDGKTMLLTGDARGDYTLKALEEAGLKEKDKPLSVDLLKLPHHGSDRNVHQDYFNAIRAKHYVISADGRFTNPEVATLEMISASRQDDDFTIWLTNAPADFSDKDGVGDRVAAFFAAETAKGRKYGVRFREKDAPGMTIEL
jgi:ribonuclease BN (tRNA processing enzyme)